MQVVEINPFEDRCELNPEYFSLVISSPVSLRATLSSFLSSESDGASGGLKGHIGVFEMLTHRLVYIFKIFEYLKYCLSQLFVGVFQYCEKDREVICIPVLEARLSKVCQSQNAFPALAPK